MASSEPSPCASRSRSEPARSTNWKRRVATASVSESRVRSVRIAKQWDRDEESFSSVPWVLRVATPAYTRRSASYESSTSSVMP